MVDFESEMGLASPDTPYLKLTNTVTGRDYFFRMGNVEGDGDAVAIPSAVGATDDEGFTQACEYLESEGYLIYLDGVNPAGFEYEGALT